MDGMDMVDDMDCMVYPGLQNTDAEFLLVDRQGYSWVS